MRVIEQLNAAADSVDAHNSETSGASLEDDRIAARREISRLRQAAYRRELVEKEILAAQKSEEMGLQPEFLPIFAPSESNITSDAIPQTKEEMAPAGVLFPGEDGNWHFNEEELRNRSRNGAKASAIRAKTVADNAAKEARQQFGSALDDSSKVKEIADFYNVAPRTIRSWRKRTK